MQCSSKIPRGVIVPSPVIGKKMDRSWLCWKAWNAFFSSQSVENSIVYSFGTHKEQACSTQILSLQNLPFINQLWDNTLRNIFPVQSDSVCNDVSVFHKCIAGFTVVSCGINSLDFDSCKFNKLSGSIQACQHPINKVGACPGPLGQS